VNIAGIGPGHPKYLTEEVKEAIKEADYIIAFNRVAKSLDNLRSDIKVIKKVEDIGTAIKLREDVLILASGDPCFYGVTEYLKEKGIAIDKIMPGLSSFQYMMTELQKSWHKAKFISLHGRDTGLEGVRDCLLSILLIDSKNPPSIISQRLESMGLKGTIYVGYNLSYDDERIIKGEIGDRFDDFSTLAVMVVENEMD